MEIDYPTVEVRLPLSLDALVSAESQVDVFVDQLKMGRDENLALALRLVVNEEFRSALDAQPEAGRLRVIRLSLRGRPEGVWISITEPGRGVRFRGALPPYPEAMIGKETCFASTTNQDLIARVDDPTRLVFRAELHGADTDTSRDEILANPGTPGMGILALCHECGEVNMTYDPIEGNSLNAFYAARL